MNGESPLEAQAAHGTRATRHQRLLPALTAQGFKRVRMPTALFADMERWYRRRQDTGQPEEGVGSIVGSTRQETASELVRIDHESDFARSILDRMQPLVEAWCGEALLAESIYGVRVYRRGAVLRRHVDHLGTHVASAVLLIAQDVDQPWPLVLEGTPDGPSEVALEPGDALLYEGARLPHHRDRPLEGRALAAVFLHYRPVWWAYTPERLDALERERPLRSLAYGQPQIAQEPPATSGGYLAFQPDHGGWNNVLMQFEIMVGLAWLTGRTLVLPPAKRHYLLGAEEHDLGAFLDLDVLGRHVPVRTAEAFARERGVDGPADFAAFSAWMAAIGFAPGWNALDDILVHPPGAVARRPALAARVGARRAVHMDDALEACEVLWFPMTVEQRMFGVAETFFLLEDDTLQRRLRRLLRDAIRYRPEVVRLAERALGDPALGRRFGALHVRRGDFQYAETRIGADRILEHIRGLYEPGATLYVATDQPDPAFLEPLRAAFHVVTFADLGIADTTPGHWAGIVETLVCAAASAPFVGTRLSTFSARIAALRGHLALTPAGRAAGLDTKLRYTQPPLDAAPDAEDDTAVPWWVAVRRVPLWGRTYQAIWRETDDAPEETSDA